MYSDTSGDVISVNYNGTEYYYLRNGQNDVVGLMDGSGARVVEYIYDAWGKPISTTGTLATSLGADNPFRYRGYYYDTETGLYYLTTRYYDPEVCRFIAADVYMTTGQGVLGGNMFAYCLNNPLIYDDDQGGFGILGTLLVGAAIGAVIGVVGNGISNLIAGENFFDGWGAAALSGAASGLLATTGAGTAVQAIGNATISASSNAYQQSQSGKPFDWLEFGVETAAGALGGFLGGSGARSPVKGTGITNAVYGMTTDLSSAPNAAKVASRIITSTKITTGVTIARSLASGVYKRVKKGSRKKTYGGGGGGSKNNIIMLN